MKELRFGVIGAGFWAQFQIAGWYELPGVRCVAIANRTEERARELARRFDAPGVYADPEEMLRREELDFVDIITDVGTHARFVRLAAERGLPVVCQKPMAANLEEARGMVRACAEAKVPFFVHENWRFQTPMMRLKEILRSSAIGQPFRARVQFSCSFPVFDNQPFLKELDQFILTDIGSHILDTARFLFGEASSLHCQTRRIHEDIRGEDVATVMMRMSECDTVVCEMSYASRLEREAFPQTYVVVEGAKGSVELGKDFWIHTTSEEGTTREQAVPPSYPWADPAYDLVHSSIVDCNRALLAGLRERADTGVSGEQNLRTVELVFGAYQSAESGEVVRLGA